MSRAELILYATPTGPLATALDALFDELRSAAPTTAQSYPPHCTLTGFFHRDPEEVDRITGEVERATATVVPGPVTVARLQFADRWIGLELNSRWLLEVTTAFGATHRLDPHDDPLRPKDWLHLSLAYGDGDLDGARERIRRADLPMDASWVVGLWQRHADGAWTDLSRR